MTAVYLSKCRLDRLRRAMAIEVNQASQTMAHPKSTYEGLSSPSTLSNSLMPYFALHAVVREMQPHA